MATQTAHRDGRMDEFAFRLILVAFEAFGRVGLWIEWNRMNGGCCTGDEERDHSKQNKDK
jgi:hypothetical protein